MGMMRASAAACRDKPPLYRAFRPIRLAYAGRISFGGYAKEGEAPSGSADHGSVTIYGKSPRLHDPRIPSARIPESLNPGYTF